MASAALTGAAAPASDLLRSSCNGMSGGGVLPLRSLGRARLGGVGRVRRGEAGAGGGVAVVAKIRKWKKHDYPWPGPDKIDPNAKGGSVGYLSHFKPLKEKPKLVTLPFEKPLMDLEKKIIDVRKMADETGLDFSDQITSLESKYQQALKDLYTHLTPIQRLSIARHPNRPTFLDHVLNITDKWVELHGDRAGYDDPAIVTGIGRINGRSYMFMGHQKGRNTKENIERNFGMPTPHGYRKALRMMYYADHHGFPIITFIDTPGAFADLKSEELGQGEAIAHNLRTMFGLKVPIVTVVIGEGGSGGALAIGCSNKLLMLENAVFYVASPEACAAILWKSAKAAPKAAEKLRITATELCKLKIADGIIPGQAVSAPNLVTWPAAAEFHCYWLCGSSLLVAFPLPNDSLLRTLSRCKPQTGCTAATHLQICLGPSYPFICMACGLECPPTQSLLAKLQSSHSPAAFNSVEHRCPTTVRHKIWD